MANERLRELLYSGLERQLEAERRREVKHPKFGCFSEETSDGMYYRPAYEARQQPQKRTLRAAADNYHCHH